jgi:predicted protein tyrosine phosphatase
MATISLLTICGLEELGSHASRGVTHVLSILDPEWPDPTAFSTYDTHHRTVLRFHDVIEPGPGLILPDEGHVRSILAFGTEQFGGGGNAADPHLLVHCHAGVSRSTAAMTMLLAQAHPEQDEDELFDRIGRVRPQAWPNSLMIGMADEQLRRDGRLTAALGRFYARHLAARPDTRRFMEENGRSREVAMAEAAQA